MKFPDRRFGRRSFLRTAGALGIGATAGVTADPTQIADRVLGLGTWPLRNRDGSIAKIDGWQITFSLVADKSHSEVNVPSDRHNFARIDYFYSRTGKSGGPKGWQFGGEVFDENAFLGNQTWAGPALRPKGGADLSLLHGRRRAPGGPPATRTRQRPSTRDRRASTSRSRLVPHPRRGRRENVRTTGRFKRDHHRVPRPLVLRAFRDR